MYTQKHLVPLARRTRLHLKSLGFLKWVSPLILNAVIPFINYIQYKEFGMGAGLYMEFLQTAQTVMPFFSIWWVVFALREYVEADGNELLFVSRGRTKLPDALALFLLYILNMAIVFGVYTAFFPQMKYEFFRVLCVCLFYFGMAYCLLFLTKSLTLTLLAALFYMLAVFVTQEGSGALFLLYATKEAVCRALALRVFLPLGLLGAVLTGAGVVLNYCAMRWR